VIAGASTAFASTGNGDFVSHGKRMGRMTSRSSITIDRSRRLARPRNGMRPVHPGEILREDVLPELGLSANALARALGVPANRITAIIKEDRGVTADTALRLSRYLGSTPEFWLNLQTSHDLRKTERESGEKIARSVKPRAA
jgi:addiction module HigA family antidote